MISSPTLNAQNNFKSKQLSFERVKSAYQTKWETLNKELVKSGFNNQFKLLIIAYKAEKVLEIWLKPSISENYKLFKTYNHCNSSGKLGPKVMEGDLQTPEGFYHINVFNPMSKYHLSLGINYPNKVDKVRTGKIQKTGGEIYIHGDCVTVGCIPLGDEYIKELYLLAVEAKNNGQQNIPVYIFPFKMTDKNLEKYGKLFLQQVEFWKTLKPGYDIFESHNKMLKVSEINGKYVIK
jgi:murein L,D-transpeptidase YafK